VSGARTFEIGHVKTPHFLFINLFRPWPLWSLLNSVAIAYSRP
jgi:hypothetical protein